MPWKTTLKRARRDKRQGKAATTQAGEFVREEMEHVKRGKHGAKSRKQAIAIGLSKARRSGVDLPPRKGQSGRRSRQNQEAAYRAGQRRKRGGKTSARRSRAGRKGGMAATRGGRRKGPSTRSRRSRRS